MLVPEGKVYLIPGYTDMRKSINGLAVQIAGIEGISIFDGSYFVFCNKRKKIIKILYWEKNGFCIWEKRIEKQTFKWLINETKIRKISSQELRWMLDGLSFFKVRAHKELFYNTLL